MIISILTLFPRFFEEIFATSIIKRAQNKNKIEIRIIDIRKFTADSHKTVDDKPYGGGVGMLLKVDVVFKALQSAKINIKSKLRIKEKIILLDAAGKLYNQKKALVLTKFDHLILICGHYEGIDARITNFIDEKISIGKFVLTGGELAASIIVDSITRLIPGVLEKPEAIKYETFSDRILKEHPQYTRPENFMGYKVPSILLSGNHEKISKWKNKNTLKK